MSDMRRPVNATLLKAVEMVQSMNSWIADAIQRGDLLEAQLLTERLEHYTSHLQTLVTAANAHELTAV